jgi:penicillin-binding protein 2
LPLHLRHQAWFIGYAPADDPKIAVAVMVEHGGYGASTAGPIARKIMDAWLLGKKPEPPVRKDGAPQAPKFDNVVSAPAVAWVPPGEANKAVSGGLQRSASAEPALRTPSPGRRKPGAGATAAGASGGAAARPAAIAPGATGPQPARTP